MADPRQAEFLQSNLDDPQGRRRWVEFKVGAAWLDLSGIDLNGLALRSFDLTEANLSTCQGEGADLTGADLSDANLTLAQMGGACLRDAALERANLTGCNLSEADLSDARMGGVNGYNANFEGANLIGADLAGADLREANFAGACLKYVRFSGALLQGANVAGADLTGCLLDPDHPTQLVNFDHASIDDRRYRQMRNRFSALFGEIEAQEATDAGLPEVAVKKRRVDDTASRDGSTGGYGADGTNGAGKEDSDPGAMHAGLPTSGEADLSTLEGCCAILGVTTEATMDDVVKAFRKKAKVYHPDKVRHLNPRLQELAAVEFQRLHLAYETLTRKTTRPLIGIVWPASMSRKLDPHDYTSTQYEELVRLNPVNTSIIYNLAWKYFEENRPWDAKAWFEKLLQITPNDEDALYNLIIIRLYLEVQLPLLGG